MFGSNTRAKRLGCNGRAVWVRALALGTVTFIASVAADVPLSGNIALGAGDSLGADSSSPRLSAGAPSGIPAQGDSDDRDQLAMLVAAAKAIDAKTDHSLFDVAALAARLGPDPVAAFHFVQSEVRYEAYYGVLRGPLGTLVDRAGNSLDRSLLLAELLNKNGRTTRIAYGGLDGAGARRLVQRMFEPVARGPAVVSSLPELYAGVGRALGLSQNGVERLVNQVTKRTAAATESAVSYATAEAASIDADLSRARVAPVSVVPSGALLAEAREHYWVQYRNDDAKWIDLDTSFRDAKPGETFARVTSTYDQLPEEAYHHLRVIVTLRTAREVNGRDESLTDTTLTDNEFRTSDLQDRDITIANVPMSPRSSSPVGSDDQLAQAAEYRSYLQVGSGAQWGKYFTLDGHVSDAPQGTGVGGLGSATRGLLGGFGGALTGAMTGKPSGSVTRVVGEWAEYVIRSPDGNGNPVEERRFHRDIVRPTTVVAWSSGDPPHAQSTATRLDIDTLRRQLLWSVRLTPITGEPLPGYRAFQLANVLAQLNLPAGTSQTDQIRLPSIPALGNVLLAEETMQALRRVASTAFSGIQISLPRPGLIAFESRYDPTQDQYTLGYDVVAFVPEFDSRPDHNAVDFQSAMRLQRLAGVLVTRMEWMRAAGLTAGNGPSPFVSNTSRVFEASRGRQSIVVLEPDKVGLQHLGDLELDPQIKADLAASLSRRSVIVAPASPVNIDNHSRYGWWKIDLDSGETIGVLPTGRGQAVSEYQAGIVIAGSLVCFWTIKVNEAFTLKGGLRELACALGTLAGIGALDMAELAAIERAAPIDPTAPVKLYGQLVVIYNWIAFILGAFGSGSLP